MYAYKLNKPVSRSFHPVIHLPTLTESLTSLFSQLQIMSVILVKDPTLYKGKISFYGAENFEAASADTIATAVVA